MNTDVDPKDNVLIEKRVSHFLLHEHVQIFWNGSTLTNKYCKMGVRECPLLRSRFVMACVHVSCFMKTVLWIVHVR